MVQQCSDLNSDMVKSPLVDLCPPLLKSSCHAHLDICSTVCAVLHSVCSCDHCALLILFARAGAGPQCDNYTSASPHTKYSILNTEYLHWYEYTSWHFLLLLPTHPNVQNSLMYIFFEVL